MANTIYCGLAKKDCYFKERMYEMEKQINKMKCCENCDNYNLCDGNFDCISEGYAFWELKESD